MVRTDGHQAPVQPVPLAQTIEERNWSPQTQRCDQGAVQPVVGPPQVLPGPAGRGVEDMRNVHDQTPALVEHQIVAMHRVAMQKAQHQVTIAPMKALLRGRVAADAPIDLSILLQSRPAGCLHLHGQRRVIGMVQNTRVVAAAQLPPRLGQAQDFDGFLGIDAAEPQLGQQLAIDPSQQLGDWTIVMGLRRGAHPAAVDHRMPARRASIAPALEFTPSSRASRCCNSRAR